MMSASSDEIANRLSGVRDIRDVDVLPALIAGVENYAIFMLDAEGRVATWNAGAQRLKGYEAEQIIGRHFSVLYPPHEIATGKPTRELEIAEATGRLEDEGWRVRQDGSRFWANVVITAMRDRDGTLLGYGKIIRDLTERRARDVELLASEERFRLMVENVQDYAILMLDTEGNVATWNAGALRLKGYLAQEIIGQHFSVFYPAEDVAAGKPQRELETAAADGRLEDEGWRVRQDGSRFWANVVITAMRGPDGALLGFGKITRDRTERRARELQLGAAVQEAEIMQTAFSDAPGGVALIGMDGVFRRVNESLCQILGRPAEDIVGFTSAPFTHPDDSGVTADTIDALSAGGARVRVDKRYLRPDGQVVWASCTSTAITGPDGKPTHIVCHFRDVTDHRAAEEKLRATEENLRAVAAAARQLPSHEHPRQAMCAAATAVADADIVQFWEPDGYDHLQVTAATGIELPPDVRLPLTGEITATAIAYHRGTPGVFLDMHAPDAPMAIALRDQLGVSSALYEPVIGRDGVLGVLVVMWKTAISEASAQVIDAVGLLATEAAAAIERADLTARLGAQTAAERLRLRQLLEGAPDAMIISDAAGVIQTVNDQTLRLLGYAREELIGESVDQLVPDGLRGGDGLDPAAFPVQPRPGR